MYWRVEPYEEDGSKRSLKLCSDLRQPLLSRF